MKELKKILFLVFTILCTNSIHAAMPIAADSIRNDIFEIERSAIVQRINFEKTRIANDYQSADMRLFNLIDSLANFIQHQDLPRDRRNLYLSRLQIFLQNINRYYSDSYLKSGTYLAALSYYPLLIEWDQKDELLRNVKRYGTFSIKATRLIPSDTIAEDFLTDYLNDHPDDVFRYAVEFDDRKFALRLLERAVKLAPESGKRYFTNENPVNRILGGSSNVYAQKSYQIFNKYGIKSRAYLLLDPIVTGRMSIDEADSLGNHPDQMFHLLVDLSTKYEANVTYSIYRYMDIYCIDALRKINQESLNSNYQYETFKRYNPEEMFVLISYGYKETTVKTLQQLMLILQKKSTGIPISDVIIASLDKEKLKQLVIYCDKNKLLDELLSLVDDDRKDYLLALATMEERESLFPPFKTFMKDNPITDNEPEDRALNEITKAKPPMPVSEDETEEPIALKPEKEKEIYIAPTPVVVNNDMVVPPVPESVQPVKIVLDDKQKQIIALKKNILSSLQNMPSYIDQDYAEEILLYAATKEPDELFKKIEVFRNKRFSKTVLEQCANYAPVSVRRYLYNPMHPVNYILSYSADPVVKKIVAINQEIGSNSKALLLLDDIIAGKIQVKDAIEISRDPNRLFRAIVKIVSRPNYIGKYSIDHEMRDFSLRFIREINDKIASGGTQPFYQVEGLGSSELYFLMLYGREEVFTSTFNGLFKRLIQKLPDGNGNNFLRGVNNNRFRDFISLCSNFGTLEEFLLTFNATQKEQILVSYVSNLENDQDNLSSVVLVAEAITNISDYPLLSILNNTIKREYERVAAANDNIGISLYGVLSSIISGNAQAEPKWYYSVSQQFKVSPVSTLLSSILFNDKVCIEQMYFYNDDDGRGSFINFMNTYRNQAGWLVEDRNSFVRVYSQTGMQVEIFANKPEFEENGISAIETYFKGKNLTPSVVVHRGHSFHTEATLERIPASAKLIFVGSCGGFYKISAALENAPEAHIISTKQVGTKTVNDAMLLSINENIRNGKDIIWNEFWDKMRDKLGNNQYFSDYISPNKNLESIFIRAYYKTLGV